MRLDQLSELQMDALREVGSIGAGHAATALSQLMGHPVGLSVPTLELVAFRDVPWAFGGPEQLVSAVHCHLIGGVQGAIMFVASRDSALGLIDVLHNRDPGATQSFGHDEEALVAHVGTILISAYVAAVARLTGMDVLPSGAAFVLDMAGAILEAAVAEVGARVETALLVRASFLGDSAEVNAVVFFLPDPDSLEVVLGRLGVV